MCYKHNQSIDIGDYMRFKLLKKATSATNRAFSLQHACGLLITPTPLASYYYTDAIVHAQAQCWKGSLSHKTALLMEGACRVLR